MKKSIWVCSLIAAVALLSALGVATAQQDADENNPQQQDKQQDRQVRRTANRPTTGGQQGADQKLAAWLLVDNEAEVALAKLAQQQASSDEVKQFAQMMMEEHSQFAEQLQEIVGATEQRPGGRAEEQSSPNEPRRERQRGQRGPNERQASSAPDFVQIKQEIGQECIASAKKELGQKEGAEFDKCYVGQQIVLHQQMLDTLKVFGNHASGELAQLISKGEATTQSHLEHAKQIMQTLDSQQ